MSSTIQEARWAAGDLLAELSCLPSGEMIGVLEEFAAALHDGLRSNDTTRSFSREVVEALAEKAVCLVGLEIADDTVGAQQDTYDEANMQWQALRWYDMGHGDGEAGREPLPQAHKEWGDW